MLSADAIPRYSDLPRRLGMPIAWGIWGDKDVLGTLNLVTADSVVAAAREIQTGRRFVLDLPLSEPDPPVDRTRSPVVQRVARYPGFGGIESFQDEVLDSLNTQISSQWDGFRHVGAIDHGYYSGLADNFHSLDHWRRHGMAGRAVVADVGRWRTSVGRPLDCGDTDVVEPDEIVGCLAAQQVEVRPGDFLLIRTGWLTWWRTLTLEQRTARVEASPRLPGLSPRESTAELLWDLHVAAVASDTPAFEAYPSTKVLPAFDAPTDNPQAARAERTVLHVRLLVLLGVPIGELFDLDDLAADCARDGRYSCFMTSAPLRVAEGVASPPNAVAVK